MCLTCKVLRRAANICPLSHDACLAWCHGNSVGTLVTTVCAHDNSFWCHCCRVSQSLGAVMEVELSSLRLLVSGGNQSWVGDEGLMVVFPTWDPVLSQRGCLKPEEELCRAS